MRTAALIYPHQLFDPHPAVGGADVVFLVEEPLLLRQYAFHKQKLIFHRASMQRYWKEQVPQACYVPVGELPDTGAVVARIQAAGCEAVRVVDPCDDWLLSRLRAACAARGIRLDVVPDPHFLTPLAEIAALAQGRRTFFFTEFYLWQRKRLRILLTAEGKPKGGKWSFDPENRQRLPMDLQPPAPTFPPEDDYVREAREYVRQHFPKAPGADAPFLYPTSAAQARAWLDDFLERRFVYFGAYEDAISARHGVLFHSVLTPVLNVGLLSPREVVEAALRYEGRVPLNSLEGFLRQVIGWREFVRLVYLARGRFQRTRNFWGHTRPVPKAFYEAHTGILPLDTILQRILQTAYCHHIERLMILGNFLLLCEVAPDAVYQWFMEMFIDAYDWVMVPNVYGMSQYADGGLMTTKPYISGSSYIRRMSDFPPGEWCAIWDALYWRFIDRHSQFFAGNPRMAVMVRLKERLGSRRLHEHHRRAEAFLERFHGG
ncbi:MAG: cryptochrome/photolyase family protein [Gemmataceae bacterium]|jgi:deoxyribodipyrimidine photolyase-related protein|nr:MAG: cryptochrome/photolyase family protein [Gemmataceae bacterium]